MENTKIAWATDTFNPWIGCEKVSAGCANCYAETQDKRWGHDRWGKGKERGRTSKAYWAKALQWNKEAQQTRVPRRVFCASMADVFDQDVPAEWREDLFNLIKATPSLTWLILTKRAKEMYEYMNKNYPTPLPNVWLGVTVEDNGNRWRLNHLIQTPAVVRWISVEPQIGLVSLRNVFCEIQYLSKWIQWVIVGGESGEKSRPFDLGWARALMAECLEAGVAFFMKQLGEYWGDAATGFKRTPKNKWDQPAEWPEDLRRREFPKPGNG